MIRRKLVDAIEARLIDHYPLLGRLGTARSIADVMGEFILSGAAARAAME